MAASMPVLAGQHHKCPKGPKGAVWSTGGTLEINESMIKTSASSGSPNPCVFLCFLCHLLWFLRCSAMFHRALPRVLPHPSNQLIWTSTISCNQSTQSIAQKSGPFAKIWRLIVRSFFTCTCNQWCKRYPAFFGQSMLNRIDFMLVCVSLLYVNIILYCIHGCMLSSWPSWP